VRPNDSRPEMTWLLVNQSVRVTHDCLLTSSLVTFGVMFTCSCTLETLPANSYRVVTHFRIFLASGM